jgi:hypothetical protein
MATPSQFYKHPHLSSEFGHEPLLDEKAPSEKLAQKIQLSGFLKRSFDFLKGVFSFKNSHTQQLKEPVITEDYYYDLKGDR